MVTDRSTLFDEINLIGSGKYRNVYKFVKYDLKVLKPTIIRITLS